MRVALLHEHPTWSIELIARMRDRDHEVQPINVAELNPGFDVVDAGVDLWINRVNAMPSAGRSPSIVAATSHLLLSLEILDQRVVNGSLSHRIGASKASQGALFAQIGLATPASVAIHLPNEAMPGATALGFPVLTKPNVGGSGSGIVRYDSSTELETAIEAGIVDLGIDGTGLVQRIIDSADGYIYRVEMLGTNVFYATRQQLRVGAFNYCAVDGCASDEAPIELFTPPPEIVEAAAQIMTTAATDVGGVEYLIDATSGEPSFYDFNPYSNFITGYDDDLGFAPIDRYIDHVLSLA